MLIDFFSSSCEKILNKIETQDLINLLIFNTIEKMNI